MSELDKALADIVAIRSQIARGTTFRGYGPATLAAMGVRGRRGAEPLAHGPALVFHPGEPAA